MEKPVFFGGLAAIVFFGASKSAGTIAAEYSGGDGICSYDRAKSMGDGINGGVCLNEST